jgi:hypothetical protein
MQRHTLRKLVPAVPIGRLVAGCAGGPGSGSTHPDFNLQQVVARGVGLPRGTPDLLVLVDNANDIQVRGSRLDIGVDVEGSHVGGS